MFVVCVEVHVDPSDVEAFLDETRRNHEGSVMEPGCLRFDVMRRLDDPDRFLLYEVYRDESAAAAHKETDHYRRWREAVEPWMAEPRRSVKYGGLFPAAAEKWATEKA